VSSRAPTTAMIARRAYRDLLHIPHDANLSVPSVYRTNKRAGSGY
jgi:hypothetical protein